MPKFVPRERKHKVRRRLEDNNGEHEFVQLDSNAPEILASHVAEKEQKRQELKNALRDGQSKISGKKKKRLDKYIDKKLQKEENLELIKKLASTKVDTSLFSSSRSLGVTKPKRELLAQALNETRAGINVDTNRKILYEVEDSGSESDVSDRPIHTDRLKSKTLDILEPKLGSGLKRPLNVEDGKPVIKKRRRLKKARPVVHLDAELSWEGFSSASDSDASPPSLVSSVGTQTESEDDISKSQSSDQDNPSEEDTSDDEDDSREKFERRQERSSAFKAWASCQVNEALGFTPTAAATPIEGRVAHKLRPPELEPLSPELEVPSGISDRKAYSVLVSRAAEVQEARLALPVVAEEQKIMEAIHNNPVVVIWGATGSGKTTQVPQFLYEAGFGSRESPNPGMIGITQPRRVAAVSMAKRVGEELGGMDDKVSYQIRFDSSVSDRTAVKFMTDGILIREIAKDFALLKYSVIVIDEAHERSTNTDILIGMVSRIVDLRATLTIDNKKIQPLKLIIMSATLRVTDFLSNPNLFRNGTPPLIKAEGRQYPVTTHFARRTQRDYVEEAFLKLCRGHKKLPPGGMLVFLTGQNEITTMMKRLSETFKNTQGSQNSGRKVRINANEAPLEAEDFELGTTSSQSLGVEDYDDEDEIDIIDEEDDKDFDIDDPTAASTHVHILPLYSQLQTKDQLRVFEKPPGDSRLIVLATNVAETSLTIPGIRYVFDTGRAKEKKYDRISGVQSFEVGWISKASASQRAGRAGRTEPGHCYRLYSSAVYEQDFAEHAEPEILRMPVEGVVLQLKSMDLQYVVNFPFPTPPDRPSLAKAENLLSYLGAISTEGKITEIGGLISQYPLSPRFSKMLTIGHQHDCMAYTIALVAALATPNLFILENQLALSGPPQSEIYTYEERQADEDRKRLRSAYNHAHHQFSLQSSTSDALKALTALCAYQHAPSKDEFCKEKFLSYKGLSEASNLQAQLMALVTNNHQLSTISNPSIRLAPPSKIQVKALQQFTAAAFIDQIAISCSEHPSPPDLPRKPTRAIDVPYLPLFPIDTKHRTDTDIIDIAVFIHPSSVLAHQPVNGLPRYVVYSHLQRGSPSTIEGAKKPRTRMHALTAVTGNEVVGLAKGTPLLVYGKPIGKIEEETSGTRKCWVIPSLIGEKGSTGWPLPAQKVMQKKDTKGEWVVEKTIA